MKCPAAKAVDPLDRVLGLVVAIRRNGSLEINKGAFKALEEEVDARVLHKQNGF